jgi:hypothetical protein
MIEFSGPDYLRNVIRIITETGLRVYKELTPIRKEHLDLKTRWCGFPTPRPRTG